MPETDKQNINYDIALFARTNFRGNPRPFGIKLDDRRKHMYIIGKTGMGKTTLQENLIIQDIRAGRGLAVVDPHGDLVEKIVNYVPPYRINDVIYFNPSDIDHPIAFNILESINPAHRHLVASGLIAVFKKMWVDSWGPRLEYILRNTILALIEYPGSTLLGVTRLLVDKVYRKKVVDNLTDPIVKAFWRDEYASFNDKFRTEAISPIQNKIGQFLSSSIIRNIVGQPKSTIDMRDIMDNGKILLLNLSKGRIGEDNAGLLGGMMITKLQLSAMSRIDIPEKERRDFFLYVDEFQNFATESFANILSEARKYRLDLIIAHQYIEQLDEKVSAAVFGNVGSIICFRVGAADAEFLEKEFLPTFTETDLVNLAKYDIYLKLMIDGVASEPFSATGLPPVGNPDNLGETVIRVSRERYASKREVVEDKISRWSGAEEIFKGTAEAQNKHDSQSYAEEQRRTDFRPTVDERPRRDYQTTAEPENKKEDMILVDRTPVLTANQPEAISLSQALQTPPTRHQPIHSNNRFTPRDNNQRNRRPVWRDNRPPNNNQRRDFTPRPINPASPQSPAPRPSAPTQRPPNNTNQPQQVKPGEVIKLP